MNKSRFRQSGVLVWFLDSDLRRSAEYLTDAALGKTIDGCFSVLVSAVMHFSGIRGKKAYEFRFRRENRDATMDRFFPGWPFRKLPQLKYYTSRTARWARMCREHFDYVREYFGALLDEYEYRSGRKHPRSALAEWLETGMPVAVPKGNVSRIVLPWKSLKLRYRRKDIIEGYRLQYMDDFLWGDPVAAYAGVDRDVPDFVVRHFRLDTASFVS